MRLFKKKEDPKPIKTPEESRTKFCAECGSPMVLRNREGFNEFTGEVYAVEIFNVCSAPEDDKSHSAYRWEDWYGWWPTIDRG